MSKMRTFASIRLRWQLERDMTQTIVLPSLFESNLDIVRDSSSGSFISENEGTFNRRLR